MKKNTLMLLGTLLSALVLLAACPPGDEGAKSGEKVEANKEGRAEAPPRPALPPAPPPRPEIQPPADVAAPPADAG